MIGYRTRRMKAGVKRIAGIATACLGLFLTAAYLPLEMWVSLVGGVMIWAGWSLFKN